MLTRHDERHNSAKAQGGLIQRADPLRDNVAEAVAHVPKPSRIDSMEFAKAHDLIGVPLIWKKEFGWVVSDFVLYSRSPQCEVMRLTPKRFWGWDFTVTANGFSATLDGKGLSIGGDVVAAEEDKADRRLLLLNDEIVYEYRTIRSSWIGSDFILENEHGETIFSGSYNSVSFTIWKAVDSLEIVLAMYWRYRLHLALD